VDNITHTLAGALLGEMEAYEAETSGTQVKTQHEEPSERTHRRPNESVRGTLDLFNEGHSPSEIAAARSLSQATIDVEHAVFDVARHFLSANEHAVNLGISRACEVGAAVSEDGKSGAREQLQRGLLQTTFRNTKLNLHGWTASMLCFCSLAENSRRVKQDRVPS